MREAADDELECGKRGAKVADDNGNPYTLAQYLAIRDSFADQWQPQGGIESAMIDMLTMAFSLQMHWSKVAHERVTRTHDAQRDQVKRFESSGWRAKEELNKVVLQYAVVTETALTHAGTQLILFEGEEEHLSFSVSNASVLDFCAVAYKSGASEDGVAQNGLGATRQ